MALAPILLYVTRLPIDWPRLIAEGGPLIWVLLIASAILNFAYFFPIVHRAFFRGSAPFRFDEAPALNWVPLTATAFGVIALGVNPDAFLSFYRLAWMAAGAITGLPTP